MRKSLITVFLIPFFSLFLFGQKNDPVLFTIKNKPVTVSEFSYIYAKTNQDKADFSEASLREYLDLYVKFKMKVQKARDLQFDTIPTLKEELEGYRRQLANSYLIDREITDKLVDEAYKRMDRDVDISHIQIACDAQKSAADTLIAYNKAKDVLAQLKSGSKFEDMVEKFSDDNTKKDNKGNIGWVNAMLPDGYYSLEAAAYNAKDGDVVGPIRTKSGYHLLRINGFRPARGEVEAAHILAKAAKPEEQEIAKAKIEAAYKSLQSGKKWEDVVLEFSDDKVSAPKGGSIGTFGINRYQKSFEDAAFSLQKDGEYSAPIQTQAGWHIVKRVSRKPLASFDTIKRSLTDRVKRDGRSEMARQNMIKRIKAEGKFEQFTAPFDKWTTMQTDSFLTYKWKPNTEKSKEVLARFGTEKTYSLSDFEEYCARAARERMSGANSIPVPEMANRLFNNWTNDLAMQYEESTLETKYPDFKSLMREYEEGNLLFFAAKELVWDKANTDTIGLQKYFDTNLKDRYKWDDRVEVEYYTIKSTDPKVISKVTKLATKKGSADLLKKFNKKTPLITVSSKMIEKSKVKEAAAVNWTPGHMTTPASDTTAKTTTFQKTLRVVPPTPKVLSECRGYAVADYQDFLEKDWIANLFKEYAVNVDEKVLKTLVKK